MYQMPNRRVQRAPREQLKADLVTINYLIAKNGSVYWITGVCGRDLLASVMEIKNGSNIRCSESHEDDGIEPGSLTECTTCLCGINSSLKKNSLVKKDI